MVRTILADTSEYTRNKKLIEMFEAKSAEQNLSLGDKMTCQQKYELAHKYYEEAYEAARIVIRSRFLNDKSTSFEKDISKKAACSIAKLYAEKKLKIIDRNAAIGWLELAADTYGDAASMYRLADLHMGSPALYMKWLRRAAMLDINQLSRNGQRVKQQIGKITGCSVENGIMLTKLVLVVENEQNYVRS